MAERIQLTAPDVRVLTSCFLKILDEYFDYSPARIPPQGYWRVYGIGLPYDISKKVYHNNAARLMGWETI